jgi:hypothetical protein
MSLMNEVKAMTLNEVTDERNEKRVGLGLSQKELHSYRR